MNETIAIIISKDTTDQDTRNVLYSTLHGVFNEYHYRLEILTLSEGETQQSYVFLEKLRKSFATIIDLTRNSNALNYVVGLVLGLRKPFIMIQQERDNIPFDCKYVRWIEWPKRKNDDWTPFRWGIANAVRDLSQQNRQFILPALISPPSRIFVSYARKDHELLKRLKLFFGFLEGYHNISFFIDESLESGEKWLRRIREEIASCNIGLLFLSPAYFESKFVQTEELSPLLNRAESEQIVLIPAISHAVGQDAFAVLDTYQALNDPSKPLFDLTGEELAEVGFSLMRRILDADRLLRRKGVI